MNLTKLYKMQKELDDHILKKNNVEMSKEERLDNTILALLVEVGELANTTRCFKYWSNKGMMDKEIILDELADVLHFYLSIGNQINVEFTYKDFTEHSNGLKETFVDIYYGALRCKYKDCYPLLGEHIFRLISKLNIGKEEVTKAYLKKHKENYRRQEEGY